MPKPFRFSLTASATTDPAGFVELARKAEDLGYSTLAMADHLDNQMAPLIALTAAASATTTLRVLSLVLANDYRHPAILAKEAATLDQFSGRRFELGIGAGWMQSDYVQGGLRYDQPGVRIARLAEAVSILKAAFTGEPVHHAGQHYQLDGFVNAPPTVQHPGPPLMIAGGGRKVLSLAGREADIVGVNPGLTAGVVDDRIGRTSTLEATDKKIGWIRDAAGQRFDSIELQTRVHRAQISEDPLAAAGMIGPTLGLSASEALESPHLLIGSEQQCIETLQRWHETWGITYIGLTADAIDEMAPVVAALSAA